MVYHPLYFLSTLFSGIIAITNSNGDKESPRKISRVSWDYRTHRLHFCREEDPPPTSGLI